MFWPRIFVLLICGPFPFSTSKSAFPSKILSVDAALAVDRWRAFLPPPSPSASVRIYLPLMRLDGRIAGRTLADQKEFNPEHGMSGRTALAK